MQAVWDLRRALDATGHNIKISADEWGLGSVAANLTIVVFAVAAAAVGAGADVVGGVVISFVSFVDVYDDMPFLNHFPCSAKDSKFRISSCNNNFEV